MADPDFSMLPAVVSEFRPNCPGCTPAKATDEDTQPCSFYDCPGLPEQLRVTCNTCMYDFAAASGQLKCDHATCETALRLKGNVGTYRAWIDLLRSEAS